MSDLFSLQGRFVDLMPMGSEHIDPLLEAADDDRSTFGFTPVPWDRTTMADYVATALAKRESGDHYPFVTIRRDDQRVVGSTRFYDLDHWDWSSLFPGSETPGRPGPDVASIGYTWLHRSAQRTPINTEAKLLMMSHAFEQWEVRAVRFWTDARNARSRAAIERLGCRLDGVLRADRPAADGTVRDSATYSLLAEEWPANRQRLTERLAD
jgi:RimJ/RimL family protein N-acetyltransferase